MQLLRYCVGLDKELSAISLSVIDIEGRVVVKDSTKMANKTTPFAQLQHWFSKYCKVD